MIANLGPREEVFNVTSAAAKRKLACQKLVVKGAMELLLFKRGVHNWQLAKLFGQ